MICSIFVDLSLSFRVLEFFVDYATCTQLWSNKLINGNFFMIMQLSITRVLSHYMTFIASSKHYIATWSQNHNPLMTCVYIILNTCYYVLRSHDLKKFSEPQHAPYTPYVTCPVSHMSVGALKGDIPDVLSVTGGADKGIPYWHFRGGNQGKSGNWMRESRGLGNREPGIGNRE